MQKKRFQLSLEIIHCDGFVEMTPPAQALYMQIVSVCDDEGFTSQLNMCKLFAHASDVDVQELVDKEFIFLLGDKRKVAVVKHWWMNTYMRDCKIVQSTFAERSLVYIKANGNYTLNPKEGKPLPNLDCDQKTSQIPTRYRPSTDLEQTTLSSRRAAARGAARRPIPSHPIPSHNNTEEEKMIDDDKGLIGEAPVDNLLERIVSKGFIGQSDADNDPKWRKTIAHYIENYGLISTSESISYLLSRLGLLEDADEVAPITDSNGLPIYNRFNYFKITMDNSFRAKENQPKNWNDIFERTNDAAVELGFGDDDGED